MRLLVTLFLFAQSTWVGADITPERQEMLLHMLQQDCGSCHGMTLKGGLGPPLTPEILRGKSSVYLRDTILDGREGTPMAPWKLFIAEEEAEWLVQLLKRGGAGAH